MPLPPHDVWSFDTLRIGSKVLVFDELPSTNSLARELPVAEEGLVVLARDQTAGRGRFGRAWRSRPGSSVLMSVVLSPRPEHRRPVVLTALAAVAVAGAVEELAGASPQIKWPNDLLVHGNKVCGVLIEQGVGPVGDKSDPGYRTVIGIGLNLMQSAGEFASAGLPDATSLQMLCGRAIDLREAVGVVVRLLDAEYQRLREGDATTLERFWVQRIGLEGTKVAVEQVDGIRVVGRLAEMSFHEVKLDSPGGAVVFPPEAIEHIRRVGPEGPS